MNTSNKTLALSLAAATVTVILALPSTALAQTPEQPITVDQLLTLIADTKWFGVVGAVIGVFAYAFSHKAAWCPVNMSDKSRAILATILSGMSTAVGGAVGWVSLGEALFAFLLSGLPTILLFIKELLSESKAAKAAARKVALGAVSVIVFASAGCGAKNVVCPVIHAADELCPMVLIELPDGTREAVPAAQIRSMAVEHRAARIGETGGSK